jgi:hypothetical protein
MNVETYFSKNQGCLQQIQILGGKTITAIVNSARLYVEAHGKKCFIIALKYPFEPKYRDDVAEVLSWRTIDIVQAYTFRWLIEVIEEDWKLEII